MKLPHSHIMQYLVTFVWLVATAVRSKIHIASAVRSINIHKSYLCCVVHTSCLHKFVISVKNDTENVEKKVEQSQQVV